MSYKEEYTRWLEDTFFDEETKKELKKIQKDEKEIKDRFYKDLEFGTAGLRGVIGAGTNRMNKYTVGKATQGLANFIKKEGGEQRGGRGKTGERGGREKKSPGGGIGQLQKAGIRRK